MQRHREGRLRDKRDATDRGAVPRWVWAALVVAIVILGLLLLVLEQGDETDSEDRLKRRYRESTAHRLDVGILCSEWPLCSFNFGIRHGKLC
jgi:hypothetical protein